MSILNRRTTWIGRETDSVGIQKYRHKGIAYGGILAFTHVSMARALRWDLGFEQ